MGSHRQGPVEGVQCLARVLGAQQYAAPLAPGIDAAGIDLERPIATRKRLRITPQRQQRPGTSRMRVEERRRQPDRPIVTGEPLLRPVEREARMPPIAKGLRILRPQRERSFAAFQGLGGPAAAREGPH